MGTFGRQKGMSGYTVDCIIAGVIGFSVLVVVIIAIVTNRRPCHKGLLFECYLYLRNYYVMHLYFLSNRYLKAFR